MASACSVYDTSHPLQICAEYPTYAESPFLALILMALDRLVQLSENPHCNRANCKMLTTYFQENMAKCLPRALGKVVCFCLSPHTSRSVVPCSFYEALQTDAAHPAPPAAAVPGHVSVLPIPQRAWVAQESATEQEGDATV